MCFSGHKSTGCTKVTDLNERKNFSAQRNCALGTVHYLSGSPGREKYDRVLNFFHLSVTGFEFFYPGMTGVEFFLNSTSQIFRTIVYFKKELSEERSRIQQKYSSYLLQKDGQNISYCYRTIFISYLAITDSFKF